MVERVRCNRFECKEFEKILKSVRKIVYTKLKSVRIFSKHSRNQFEFFSNINEIGSKNFF